MNEKSAYLAKDYTYFDVVLSISDQSVLTRVNWQPRYLFRPQTKAPALFIVSLLEVSWAVECTRNIHVSGGFRCVSELLSLRGKFCFEHVSACFEAGGLIDFTSIREA